MRISRIAVGKQVVLSQEADRDDTAQHNNLFVLPNPQVNNRGRALAAAEPER